MHSVAVIQLQSKQNFVEDNVNRALAIISKAVDKGANVIILPEMWSIGPLSPKIINYHLKATVEILERLQEVAAKHKIYIITGSFPEDSGQAMPYNTVYVINPHGDIYFKYRKMNLFKPMQEHKKYYPGLECRSFFIDEMCCGLIVCYDLRFPELTRKLAAEYKIQSLFVPAAWPVQRVEHWDVLLRARAIENQINVVATNLVGISGEENFAGHSQIISPMGEVRQMITDHEGFVTALI